MGFCTLSWLCACFWLIGLFLFGSSSNILDMWYLGRVCFFLWAPLFWVLHLPQNILAIGLLLSFEYDFYYSQMIWVAIDIHKVCTLWYIIKVFINTMKCILFKSKFWHLWISDINFLKYSPNSIFLYVSGPPTHLVYSIMIYSVIHHSKINSLALYHFTLMIEWDLNTFPKVFVCTKENKRGIGSFLLPLCRAWFYTFSPTEHKALQGL